MSTSERRDIVPIHAFPSCDDCLHWGEDGIVIAAQQNVQLLVEGVKGWKVESLRVNLFSEQEWPHRKLAPISRMSVGEELSDSHVVSARYSPSGVGIHRRAVLTVLTSNLLLSIWETDGSNQGWRRTCVVNHFLEDDHAATTFRIRAFEWLPTLTEPSTKWGDQFMVVVDDADRMYCLRISKISQTVFGGWNVEVARQTVVLPSLQTSPGMTSLQRSMTIQSKVCRLSSSGWIRQQDNACVLLKAWRKNTQAVQQMVLKISFPTTDLSCSFIPESTFIKPRMFPRFGQSPEQFPGWQSQLEKIGTPYSRTFQLEKKYRIQCWGQMTSPDGQDTAICVSLHPWDRYEYGSAVHERSHVLLNQKSSKKVYGSAAGSLDDVLGRVITSTLEFLSKHQLANEIESSIVRVLVAWTSLTSHAKHQQLQRYADAQTEICDMCETKILLPDDLSATCESGHAFTRCNLTLFTIQEPGISKTCSNCKRHFLHDGKLGPLEDPSLLRHLSHAFDVCPYCGGKYFG